jgi:hypothetical protein
METFDDGRYIWFVCDKCKHNNSIPFCFHCAEIKDWWNGISKTGVKI